MFLILVILLSLAIIVVVLPIIIYLSAKDKKFATFVKEGTMEFVVKGEDLHRVLLNTDGYVFTRNGEIKLKTDAVRDNDSFYEEPLLARLFGLYWVSWLYPLFRIKTFEITIKRLRPKSEVARGKPMNERIEHEGTAEINNVRHTFPRPFIMEAVETQDGFEVDLVGACMLRVVIPRSTMYKMGVEFFTTIESTINSAVGDYVKSKATYPDFLKSEKGPSSEFSEWVKKRVNPGMLQNIGVVIDDGWIDDYSLSPKEKEVQAAMKAKEKQILLGDADVARAERDKTAAEHRAKGHAAEIHEIGAAYKAHEDVAEYISRHVVSQNLGQNSNIAVLNAGGLIPSINIGERTTVRAKKPSEPPPVTETKEEDKSTPGSE